jgi:hypothetical protein
MQPRASRPMRRPAWSGRLTGRLSRLIPARRRSAALAAIRAIHTLLFVSIGAAIAVFVWDGARQTNGRRTAYALGVAVAETGIYVSNNQVCPLTPLAEELGADSGAVADLFLPAWVARRIPVIASAALVTGLALHTQTILSRRWSTRNRWP